jgi:hypothetical protein
MITLQASSTILNELWVTIVTTLFILSLISERLGNLIKLYWQSAYEEEGPEIHKSLKKNAGLSKVQVPKALRPTKAGRFFGNLRYKQIDPALEKEREKGVQTVAVICGILVSIFSGADLFNLIQGGKTLNWQDWFAAGHDLLDLFHVFDNANMFSHAMGVIFAGLFVSLGSKFWHDILDFVLYSSNLKQKLADPRTFQGTRIEEVDEWLAMYPGDLGRRAYDQYAAALAKNGNVAYIAQTSENYNGVYQDVIRVYLKDNDDGRFRSIRTLPVKLESNRIVEVPILVITGVGDVPSVHGGALKGVSVNKKGVGYAGAICCIVEDGDNKYFLTCNHVLTEGKYQDLSDNELKSNFKVEIKIRNKTIEGVWSESIQNEFFDIALISPLDKNTKVDFENGVNLNPLPRIITKGDSGLALKVLRRMKAENVPDTGTVEQTARLHDYHVSESIPIEYSQNKIVNLIGLLEIENSSSDGPVSVKGDSGALVYDDSNTAVGMIVAGNKRFSYAIPMIKILEKTSTKIATNLNV